MKEGDVRIKRIENGWVVSRWITYPLPTPSPIDVNEVNICGNSIVGSGEAGIRLDGVTGGVCDGRRVRSDYCQTWDEIMKILETCDVINSVMEE